MNRIFSVVLLFCTVALAKIENIVTVNDINFIDSLLYKGNLERIIDYFRIKDQKIEELNLTKRQKVDYLNFKKTYTSIGKNISNFESLDELSRNNLINQYLKFETRFDSLSAGIKSYTLYQTFKTFSEKGEKVNAIKFYLIAYFFKGKYIRQTIHFVRNSIKIAYKNYDNNYFDKTITNISRLFEINRNISLPPSIVDSLIILQSKIRSKEEIIERNEHFWEDERLVKNNLNFTIGFHLIRQNAINNNLLEFKQKIGKKSELVNIEYISGKLIWQYSARIDYRVLNSLFLGVDIKYSEFTYSSKNILDLVFFDFKLQNYSSHFFFKYQSRYYVGLRPYITLGLGYLISQREKTDGIILKFADDLDTPPTALYYDVPNKVYKFSQVLYEAGLDYLPAPNLPIILGSKLSLYQNINFNKFIGQFNFAFGVYVSYWF
jgi:hypothetical protein